MLRRFVHQPRLRWHIVAQVALPNTHRYKFLLHHSLILDLRLDRLLQLVPNLLDLLPNIGSISYSTSTSLFSLYIRLMSEGIWDWLYGFLFSFSFSFCSSSLSSPFRCFCGTTSKLTSVCFTCSIVDCGKFGRY